jgi:hypothetical protein
MMRFIIGKIHERIPQHVPLDVDHVITAIWACVLW